MNGDTNREMEAEIDVEDVEVTDGSDLFTDEADTDVEDEGEDLEEDADEGDDEEDDFEDDESEEDDTESEEPDKKKADKSKPADNSAPKPLKVTHLGVEKEIDPYSPEGIALVQKGLNYDHEHEAYVRLKSSLDEAAKASGQQTDAFLKSIVETTKAAMVESAKAKIRTKYPGAPEELVSELAGKQAAEEAAQLKLDAEATAESTKSKDWEELKKAYPEVTTMDKLPQPVREAIEAGKSPLLAMLEHKNSELRKEVADLKTAAEAAKKNKENQERSTGSAKGTAGTKKKDGFLSGLGL